MKKEIKEFLTDVKEEKQKQLMGIALDMAYWNSLVEGNDEPSLRKELSLEQGKMIQNEKTGKIIKDERDIDRINEISRILNTLTKADEELAKLGFMKKDILRYVGFVNNPPKEVIKAMEEALSV